MCLHVLQIYSMFPQRLTLHPGGLGGELVAAIAIIILLLLLVSVLSGALLVVLVMKRSKHETIDKSYFLYS